MTSSAGSPRDPVTSTRGHRPVKARRYRVMWISCEYSRHVEFEKNRRFLEFARSLRRALFKLLFSVDLARLFDQSTSLSLLRSIYEWNSGVLTQFRRPQHTDDLTAFDNDVKVNTRDVRRGRMLSEVFMFHQVNIRRARRSLNANRILLFSNSYNLTQHYCCHSTYPINNT